MSGAGDIARARTEAKLARLRLTEDVTALRGRLSPSGAVADLRDRATDAVATLQSSAVEAVRRRPAVVVGGIVALGLLAAIGPVRRAAIGTARALWRNRAAIERFIDTKRIARKDQRP